MVSYYFGYGSNIWIAQMKRRCPGSELIGVGTLKNWRWFINKRGVGNIAPSAEGKRDVVYGFIYAIDSNDEAALDASEGAPQVYQKTIGIPVELSGTTVTALVYIDFGDVEDGVIRKEYIARLQSAARDGKQRGIPGTYFAKYWGPFMPIHYFAYGINMSINEMKAKSPKAEFVKTVELKKWRWFIDKGGKENIAPSASDSVHGFIYKVNAFDEAALDVSEAPHKVIGIVPGDMDLKDAFGYANFISSTDGTRLMAGDHATRLKEAKSEGKAKGIPPLYFETYWDKFLP